MNYLQIQNNSSTKIVKSRIKSFIFSVLEYIGKDKWEISILFTDDEFIRELNRNYRKRDEATDVLSFAQVDTADDFLIEGDRFYAGDIVISMETLAKNSNYFNVGMNEELKRLLVHGILHLSGMDHVNNNPDQEMLAYQEKILNNFTGVILI